jgi:RimJ/RimL family protein N-acetyltransferase
LEGGDVNPVLLDLPFPIRTDRLLIRPEREGDGAELNAAILDSFAELHAWMPWAREKPTPEESEENVRRAIAKFISREDLRLAIYDPSSPRLLGMTGLHVHDWKVPALEVGYWVRTPEAGKGYITEAVAALSRYAFEVIGVKRLQLHCDADNERSSAIARRLGFVHEGALRMNGFKADGKRLRDTLVFARYSPEGLPASGARWG